MTTRTWNQLFSDTTALLKEYRRRALALAHASKQPTLTHAVEALLVAEQGFSAPALELLLTRHSVPEDLESILVTLEETYDLQRTVSTTLERNLQRMRNRNLGK